MVWRLANVFVAVPKPSPKRLLPVSRSTDYFFFPDVRREQLSGPVAIQKGAADCVGLNGESCWHCVNITANPAAILDTVIVRLMQTVAVLANGPV